MTDAFDENQFVILTEVGRFGRSVGALSVDMPVVAARPAVAAMRTPMQRAVEDKLDAMIHRILTLASKDNGAPAPQRRYRGVFASDAEAVE